MNILKETTEKRVRFWSEFAFWPFWLFYALYYYYKINYFNYISYLFAAVSIVSNIVIIKNSFNKRKIEKLEFERETKELEEILNNP